MRSKRNYMRHILSISLLLLIFASPHCLAAGEGVVVYKQQQKSLIKWDEINAENWLDIDLWKLQTESLANSPDWERKLRERQLVEVVGRVLSCVGECRAFRGDGHHRAHYRTRLQEGDEIETGADSYLWIILIDGTMVRLSPQSSITLREIDIGKTQNFLQARFNHGNILWLARTPMPYEVTPLRETDSLFLPLDFFEANQEEKPIDIFGSEYNDEQLYELLVGDNNVPKQIRRLNELVDANNERLSFKPSQSMLVMGNGTIVGTNLSVEAIVIPGKSSFFKLRDLNQLGVIKSDIAYDYNKAELFFRGYENTRSSTLSEGKWYELDERGRSLSDAQASSLMHMGEFLTSKIHTLNVARELWLAGDFAFSQSETDPLALATTYGYRLWEIEKDKNQTTDLELRLEWLKDYSRRIETSNLQTAALFRERLRERGEKWAYVEYGPHMVNRALVNYIKKGEAPGYKTGRGPVLNSTTRLLWKKITALR